MTAPLVAIDADVLGRQRTGDETYVENLLRELGHAHGDLRLAAVTRHPELVPPGIEPASLPARSRSARYAFRLPALLRRMRPTVAHFQYIVPPGAPGAAVVTVHDLSFERSHELMGVVDRTIFRALVPRSVRRADRVLTVSERTKRDLIEHYGLPESKIVVTPNGVDPVFTREGPARNGSPYALFVGAIQPRKDPLTALRALARSDSALRLVMAGPHKRGGREVREEIRRLGLERRVELPGYVPKDELAALYRGAVCLVFPSRDEGFGLPVVEAMACGTAVVGASAGAIPEVAGNAAILVEPGDPDALAEGIVRALADRDRLVAAGLDRARKFTWAETARLTLDVYRELL